MERTFHPPWTSFHNAKSFQRGFLATASLLANPGQRPRTRPERLPYQLTAHPGEIFRSPPGTRTVKFMVPPALSTRVDWWHTAFFLLQRWCLSPDRGIRIVILLRFCWIGVYCFDLCNNTYFLNDCMFHFFRGFEAMRAKEWWGKGRGCWRKDLEWWWCGFWPSRPGICTLMTEDTLWLHRLTLQRLKGKPELHVAGNEGVFQV